MRPYGLSGGLLGLSASGIIPEPQVRSSNIHVWPIRFDCHCHRCSCHDTGSDPAWFADPGYSNDITSHVFISSLAHRNPFYAHHERIIIPLCWYDKRIF